MWIITVARLPAPPRSFRRKLITSRSQRPWPVRSRPTRRPRRSLPSCSTRGAIDGPTGTGQSPASGDQSACLIAALDTQMDYVCANWLYQSYYETNATNSHPIVLYFIGHGTGSGDWPAANFNTVWSGVAAHATSGNSCGSGHTYTATVDFIDQSSGAFSETGIAGGFAWPQPNAWSGTNQFCWEGNPCSFNYLADFYATARANSGKIAVGALYKGFDDYNASWGSNRVIAQDCGQS